MVKLFIRSDTTPEVVVQFSHQIGDVSPQNLCHTQLGTIVPTVVPIC